MTIMNGDDISKPCGFFVLNVKASITEANLIVFSELEVIRVVITCSKVELKLVCYGFTADDSISYKR